MSYDILHFKFGYLENLQTGNIGTQLLKKDIFLLLFAKTYYLYNLKTVIQITYCQNTVAKLQESQITELPI